MRARRGRRCGTLRRGSSTPSGRAGGRTRQDSKRQRPLRWVSLDSGSAGTRSAASTSSPRPEGALTFNGESDTVAHDFAQKARAEATRHDRLVQDDDVRASCFAALDVICAKHGPDVPYASGLDQGFAFRRKRVPFLNYQKGIYRAAAQKGPAALSVNTSYRSPYDDEETASGFRYAYREGSIDQADNRALRAAHALQVPLVYFVGTRPAWYRPSGRCSSSRKIRSRGE